MGPECVLITAGQIIKLIDFGFASICRQRGRQFGRIDYQAPEADREPLNPAIDLYGIGVVLYYLTAGTYSDMEAVRKRISALRNNLQIFFAEAMEGLLKPDPEERWDLARLTEYVDLRVREWHTSDQLSNLRHARSLREQDTLREPDAAVSKSWP